MADAGNHRDQTVCWVFGKVTPGWYCAMVQWNEKVAAEWREKGYEVQRSQYKPGTDNYQLEMAGKL